jgi:hypothetical protein
MSNPASKPQTWAIFCATKLDVRNLGLTYDEASSFLDRFNNGEAEQVVAELRAKGATGAGNGKPKSSAAEHRALFERAVAAAEIAAAETTPTPMLVGDPKNMMASLMGDDGGFREDRPIYKVASGACGYAWVNVKPGTSSFAKWLVKNGHGYSDSYYGGVSVQMRQGGQSYEIKCAAASAFAKVLRDAGMDRCYSYNRLD